jgi:GNAT superfamily N-acetyltransferase
MNVRLAVPADHDQWLPLWLGYQQFYQTEIAPTTTATTWARFHDPAEPMQCAVAESEGELIGMVHCITHRSCWTVGDYVYLQDLFVSSAARGQGVGRALIEWVYQQARASGASRVHWLTQETNAQAMLLYDRIAKKSGFIQYRKIF